MPAGGALDSLADARSPALDLGAIAEAVETALGGPIGEGDAVRLPFVAGDVLVRVSADVRTDRLNWPSTCPPDPVAKLRPGPAWQLDVVRMTSALEERLAGLPGPDWQRCDRTGRASFPSAWLPLPDGRLVLYGQERHLVLRRGTRIVLAVRAGSDPARWAQRTLRQLMVRSGQRRGLRLVHAAVLAAGGQGVLFVGESGVGKTDLALRTAAACGAAVIAVDRCLVGTVNGALVASALPFGFNVAEQTLAALGVRPADLVGVRPPVLAKRYLDLTEVRRLCRVAVEDRCEIAGVIRLHRPTDPRATAVRQMSPATAAAVVEDELDYIDPGFPTDWLGILDGTPPPPKPNSAISGLETWFPAGSDQLLESVRRWLAVDSTLPGRAGNGERSG